MKRLLHVFCLVIGLGTGFTAMVAQAQTYADPTAANAIRAMLRFGVLDLDDDRVIDDYAKYMECDLYKSFYDDDFKWQRIRGGLRQTIQKQMPVNPTAFYATGTLHLDRYDFEQKMYRLGRENGIRGVNTFVIAELSNGSCKDKPLRVFPSIYRAVLETPVTIPGLYMSETDAKALLERMTKAGNDSKEVYVKFKVRIVFAKKILLDDKQQGRLGDLNFTTRLDAIEFYEDREMTRLFYSYDGQ